MERKIIKEIKNQFSFLISRFDFEMQKINFFDKNNVFNIIYKSKNVLIKIENDRRELFVRIASRNLPKYEIDLSIVIEYLNMYRSRKIESNFYSEIKNFEKCFYLQTKRLAKILLLYYPMILNIFHAKYYKNNIKKLDDFARKRAECFFNLPKDSFIKKAPDF